MAENNEIKIKAVLEGKGIPDTIAGLKALAKEIKAVNVSSKENTQIFTDSAKALTVVRDKTLTLEAQSLSSNAKMKNSYFLLGEELRRNTAEHAKLQQQMQRTNPAMISFNQIVQDAPFGLRGMGNNIQFLTQQFTQLRAGGMTTQQILGGMMRNIFTPMGGLMLAVSVGTSALTMAFDAMGKKSKEADDKLKDYRDTLTSIKELYFELSGDIVAQIIAKQAEVEQKRRAWMQGMFPTKNALGMITSPADTKEQSAEREKAFLEALNELKKLQNSFWNDMAKDERARIAKENKEKYKMTAEEFRKMAEARFDAQFGGGIPYAEVEDPEVLIKMYQRGIFLTRKQQDIVNAYAINMQKENLDRRVGGYKFGVESEKEKQEKAVKVSEQNLREAMNLYNSLFFDPLRAGFDAVINKSGSFADAFVASLKKMMAQLVEFAILSGILSMLFPSVGFGAIFGQLSGLGGKLPKQVSLAGGGDITGGVVRNMSRKSPLGAIEIYGEARLQDDHVLVQYRRANSKRNLVKV